MYLPFLSNAQVSGFCKVYDYDSGHTQLLGSFRDQTRSHLCEQCTAHGSSVEVFAVISECSYCHSENH